MANPHKPLWNPHKFTGTPHVLFFDLIQNLPNLNEIADKNMRDNNKDLTIGEFSSEIEAVSGFASFMTRVFSNFKNRDIQLQDEHAVAEHQSDRRRKVEKQYHHETIKQMPLEQLIRTGFYPF